MKAPKMNTTPRELVPEGNHIAHLQEIMYLGTIETMFMNDDGTKKEQYKVRLTFELTNELREFGEDKKKKPMVISKECTFSLYKGTQTAVLRTIAHALIGQALKDEEAESLDIDDLLGKACMVEVSHEEYKDNKYAKAVGFGSVPKGMKVPKQINESRSVNVQDIPEEDLQKLPEFIRKKMESSKEYRKRFNKPEPAKEVSVEINPDDIPF